MILARYTEVCDDQSPTVLDDDQVCIPGLEFLTRRWRYHIGTTTSPTVYPLGRKWSMILVAVLSPGKHAGELSVDAKRHEG